MTPPHEALLNKALLGIALDQAHRLQEYRDSFTNMIDGAEKLADVGIRVELGEWSVHRCDVRVERCDLPKVYKALGKLEVYDRDPGRTDDEVKVTLRPASDAYRNLHFVYYAPLAPNSKCRVRTYTYTGRSLVCST
jgi:hypothetical protein